MKTLLAIFLLSLASTSFAEVCTAVIKDRYGYEYQTHTRSSYSREAACSDAMWSCRQALSDGQAHGQYYDSTCEIKNDYPYPTPSTVICTTDMVDYWGTILRTFSGAGRNDVEACRQSDDQCRYELNRGGNGARCITRGVRPTPGPGPGPIPGPGPGPRPPRPPQNTTESCRSSRFDPSGLFIQSYMQSVTGPIGTDVKGEACRRSLSQCQRDIKGRQTCRIDG